MSNVLDMMWSHLQTQLVALKREIGRQSVITERAETAGGVPSSTFAAAPMVNVGPGDLLFISDALKCGETTGGGTGTLCYYNNVSNQWYRVCDDTAVSI